MFRSSSIVYTDNDLLEVADYIMKNEASFLELSRLAGFSDNFSNNIISMIAEMNSMSGDLKLKNTQKKESLNNDLRCCLSVFVFAVVGIVVGLPGTPAAIASAGAVAVIGYVVDKLIPYLPEGIDPPPPGRRIPDPYTPPGSGTGRPDLPPYTLPGYLTDPPYLPPGRSPYGPYVPRDLWGGARSAAPRQDPLIFDLTRDGKIDTSGSGYFDLDANGFAELTSWVSGGDGLLVMDRNGDGIINDGTELFGDRTVLRNGSIAGSGLEALADLGITSINLNALFDGSVDAHNNIYGNTGNFQWSDGSTGSYSEVFLTRAPEYSIPLEWAELTPEILALPELFGAGNLNTLRQTIMTKDPDGRLKVLLDNFKASENSDARHAILADILCTWGELTAGNIRDRGSNIDARMLAFLELYMGEAFVGVGNSSTPNASAAGMLKDAFNSIVDYFYPELMAQTVFADYFSSLIIDIDLDSGALFYDIMPSIQLLKEAYVKNPEKAKEELEGFTKTLVELGYGNTLSLDNIKAFKSELDKLDSTFSTIFDKSITVNLNFSGTARGGEMFGAVGDDTIIGSTAADRIYGGKGNDTLNGGYGYDTLIGGKGDDRLEGGAGNDTYIWNLGDGNDTIYDYEGQNVLKLGAGINPEDIEISRSQNNLLLKMRVKLICGVWIIAQSNKKAYPVD